MIGRLNIFQGEISLYPPPRLLGLGIDISLIKFFYSSDDLKYDHLPIFCKGVNYHTIICLADITCKSSLLLFLIGLPFLGTSDCSHSVQLLFRRLLSAPQLGHGILLYSLLLIGGLLLLPSSDCSLVPLPPVLKPSPLLTKDCSQCSNYSGDCSVLHNWDRVHYCTHSPGLLACPSYALLILHIDHNDSCSTTWTLTLITTINLTNNKRMFRHCSFRLHISIFRLATVLTWQLLNTTTIFLHWPRGLPLFFFRILQPQVVHLTLLKWFRLLQLSQTIFTGMITFQKTSLHWILQYHAYLQYY